MLSEFFKQVLVQYPSARERENIAGHPLGTIVRNSIPDALKTCALLPDQYIVKGSVGQGSWAAVPWIAVMDKRVTTTTQDGIYIVYLFAEDGSALYLTLNQGCTETIKNHGRRQTGEILLQTADRLRSQLSVPQKLFASENIQIGNIFYEQGCIAYKCYERNNLPSDDRLIADLEKFCALYEKYCAALHGDESEMKKSPAERIPFSLDEAAILLNAYLSYSQGDISKVAVAKVVSQKLRRLAASKGISINDAFRSPAGIQGRLRSIGAVYEGSESCAAPGTQVFAEAVNLYKNSPQEFQKLLRKITILRRKMDDKVPGVSAKDPIQANSNEQYDGSGIIVNKQVQNMEQDFFQWLSSAVSHEVLDDFIKSYKLINAMLVQKKVLSQPLVSITMVSQVETASQQVKRVFVNKKHRNTATKLLTAYITYLKGKNKTAFPTNALPEVEVQKGWIRFDFTNSCLFERTAPIYCIINSHEITEKNWARVLVAIVEMEIKNKNPKLQELYTRALMSQREDHPFFLTDKIIGLHCAKLSNGYWLNINYSIPRLMDQIKALCLHFGYSKEKVIFYGVAKSDKFLTETVRNKPPVEVNKIPNNLLVAIRHYYSGGLRFDDTVLRLLEERSGLKIDTDIQSILQKTMFHRSDDLFFLQEMAGNTKQLLLIQREILIENISEFGCIDLKALYRNFQDQGEATCLRDEDDFADYLMFLMPNDIRIAGALKTRIIKKIGVSVNDAVELSARKVVQTIKANGCITQEDLLLEYTTFTDVFLRELLEKHSDEVILTKINDFMCYQSIESMGLDAEFSSVLYTVLEEIKQLSLPPSQEIIHALLSVKLGYNLRDEYCIPDDKTFRHIISMYYTDKKLRVWKSGSFVEVDSDNV